MSQQFTHYIILYGYLAVFVIIYLQEIGLPIPLPNEVLLLFSGYLAFKKAIGLLWLIPVAATADFMGTMTLFVLFFYFGDSLIRLKWFPLSKERLERLRLKIDKGGWNMISVCRITPFIRGYTSVAAGLLHLPVPRYALTALLSSLMVCSTYISFGYLSGSSYGLIAGNMLRVRDVLLMGLSITAVLFIFQKVLVYFRDKGKRKAALQYQRDQLIKLHVVSETEWVTQGQGVHTAFVELNELLAEAEQIEISSNEAGSGNIFHSHTYGPYYFWKGWRYKGRRILTAHVIPDSSKGTIPYWKLLLPLTTRYLKMAYSFADVVIAISPTVERALRELGVKSRIVRIYNPVLLGNWKRTPENRQRGREILGLTDHEKMVLGVGQLQERKGVEDFIDMAASMPETRFVWVGGRPWGAFTEGVKRINSRIENAPANLSFTGLLDLKEMPAMYAAADLFIFPSYQENCPLAPLEAAASGLPVIFRDIPEYRSLFSLPYLKAATTGEFTAMAAKLLDDDNHYKQAVRYSSELLNLFDREAIRDALLALYKQTLDDCLETGPVISPNSKYSSRAAVKKNKNSVQENYQTIERQELIRGV